jgi:hypothetical protein
MGRGDRSAQNAVLGTPAKFQCGAKTRSGRLCQNPPMGFGIRCRMHGGAPGSGAPIGNKNALKNGYYTREAIEARRELAKSRREAAEYDNSWIDALVQRVRREPKKAEQARLRQTAETVGYDNSHIDAVVQRFARARKKSRAGSLSPGCTIGRLGTAERRPRYEYVVTTYPMQL